VVEIHGGETLKIVQNSAPPSNAPPGVQFDKAIPLLYLGHSQTFELVCGNYGDTPQDVIVNKRVAKCDERGTDKSRRL